ncbi:MAG TPA: hemerythrin domain-containing protein [Kofleriaceae bacterium]|nr:hemerythrin domain-containing protein [Kofleriaceae bacterium]
MKGTTTTDALELLMSQHEEIESLIEDIEEVGDPGLKGDMFRALADSIAAHSAIEEKMFYPSVMHETTRELLVEFTEEHLSIKRLVADMLHLDPADEHFDAKLTVLKEQFRHHAHDEEEDLLFPKVRELFDEDELAALGNELLAKYEELVTQEPRRHVPDETREAAPLL